MSRLHAKPKRWQTLLAHQDARSQWQYLSAWRSQKTFFYSIVILRKLNIKPRIHTRWRANSFKRFHARDCDISLLISITHFYLFDGRVFVYVNLILYSQTIIMDMIIYYYGFTLFLWAHLNTCHVIHSCFGCFVISCDRCGITWRSLQDDDSYARDLHTVCFRATFVIDQLLVTTCYQLYYQYHRMRLFDRFHTFIQ